MNSKIIKIFVLIALTIIIACQSPRKKKNIKSIKSENIVIKEQTNDSIPIFLKGFLYNNVNGKKFTFETVKGKVLLLDFWSTNCAPCIREHPNVIALKKKINNNNFEVITISIDKDIEKWKAFIKKNNWQGINLNINSSSNPNNPLHKMIFEPLKHKNKTYYKASTPTYYLIDKNAKVIIKDKFNNKKFQKNINSLLLEK